MNKIVGTIIAITVSALIIVVCFVNVINPIMTNSPDTTDSWQYDDYRIVDNASSATGALELVTVGSTQYVHANGIGTGTITFSDSTTKTVTVNKATLDLYLMTGQSNAAYTQPDKTKSTPVPSIGTSYYYGTSSEPIYRLTWDTTACGMYDLIDSSGALRIGDKAPAFCSDYYNATGHKAYWVCAGVGAKSIDKFIDNGQMWNHNKLIMQYAVAAVDTTYYDLHIKSFFFIQGCSNYSTSTDDYYDMLAEYVGDMLDGDLGYNFDYCFISKVRAVNAPTASPAQIELCKTSNRIVMATEISDTFTVANGLMNSDDLHYSPLGNNLIGDALANAVIDTYGIREYVDYSSVAPLINVIPLLLVIGLVLAAAGIVVLKVKK